MADKFTDAPIGATHYADGPVRVVYYRFDGHVWKFWDSISKRLTRCHDNKPSFPVEPLPTPPRNTTLSEHTLCCGTTCDKQAVNRYIKQLEEVADAARGFLAGNLRTDELRSVLSEVGK